jgi:hypothetical protein
MWKHDRAIKRSPAAIDPGPGLNRVIVELEISYPVFDCFVLQRDRSYAFIMVYLSSLVDPD